MRTFPSDPMVMIGTGFSPHPCGPTAWQECAGSMLPARRSGGLSNTLSSTGIRYRSLERRPSTTISTGPPSSGPSCALSLEVCGACVAAAVAGTQQKRASVKPVTCCSGRWLQMTRCPHSVGKRPKPLLSQMGGKKALTGGAAPFLAEFIPASIRLGVPASPLAVN